MLKASAFVSGSAAGFSVNGRETLEPSLAGLISRLTVGTTLRFLHAGARGAAGHLLKGSRRTKPADQKVLRCYLYVSSRTPKSEKG